MSKKYSRKSKVKTKIRKYGNGLTTFFSDDNGVLTSKVLRNGEPLIEITAVPIKAESQT